MPLKDVSLLQRKLVSALEQLAKAEVKLVAVFLVGCTLLLPLLAFSALQRDEMDATADVYDCNATLNGALQRWTDAERRAGVEATVMPVTDATTPTGIQRYQVHYVATNLTLFRLSLGPLPEPLAGNCRLSSYGVVRRPSWANLDDASTLGGMLTGYAAIALLVPLSLCARRESLIVGKPLREGLRVVPLWCLPLGVATWASMSLLVQIFTIDMQGVRDVGVLEASPWIAVAVGLFAAPVFEELLFRRWLLDGFLRANLPVFGSVVVSINFALLHLSRYELSATFFSTFGLFFGISLVLCWVYARTRNVFAGMAVHCAHNASALMAGFMLP